MKNISSFKKECDGALIEFLQKKETELSTMSNDASILIRIISSFIQNGGKRIRPALYYFASTSYGIDKNEAMRLSLTFELFQTFCLIHDDIIDQSPLRRGNKTVHSQYNIPTAILAGDMALMLADEIFFEKPPSASVKQTYDTFKQEVLLGEYLDSTNHPDVETIMDLKTARYTFIRPVELGLQTAQVDQKIIDTWKHIMYQIGIAFQLKDDLTGVYGIEVITGKSSDSDLQEKKNTYLIELFKQNASTDQLKVFNNLFKKKKLKSGDCDQIRSLFTQCTIPTLVQAEIIQKVNNSKESLHSIPYVKLHDLVEEVLAHIVDFGMIMT
ncbi:MAG: polyprenyl synthetase family protein [bacterium]|nr:polyprenyl synthetase family protein [bacterium]